VGVACRALGVRLEPGGFFFFFFFFFFLFFFGVGALGVRLEPGKIFFYQGRQQAFIHIYLNKFFFFFTWGDRPWVAPLCLRPCVLQ
jgi:hypothetical protein